jgi:hypothetical protein
MRIAFACIVALTLAGCACLDPEPSPPITHKAPAAKKVAAAPAPTGRARPGAIAFVSPSDEEPAVRLS